jgi:hypothetical protein
MSKQRREAANMVAKTLFATETAIDSALPRLPSSSARCQWPARTRAFRPWSARKPWIMPCKALAALNEARRAVVAAHNALFEVQGQIGLGAVNFGGLVDKPAYPQASMPALRSVA